MRTFPSRAMAAAAAGVLGGLVLTVGAAAPTAAASVTDPAAQAAARSRCTTSASKPAPPRGASEGSWWDTVDDGSAAPRMSHSRAVPRIGTLSLAADTDPTACDTVGGRISLCWRGCQTIGNEVRVWTTWRGQSCVVIGSTTGDPTRILCGAVPAST